MSKTVINKKNKKIYLENHILFAYQNFKEKINIFEKNKNSRHLLNE